MRHYFTRYKLLTYRSAAFQTVRLLCLAALISNPALKLQAAQQFASVPTEAIGEQHSLDIAGSAIPPALLSVTFALKSDAASGMNDYVATLTAPSSSNYHKWLTPEQFGARFGAKDSDISTVTSYLQNSGFSNIKIWRNKLFVTGHISAANAETLFHTTLHSYVRSSEEIAGGYSRTYFAPENEPAVDTEVASKLNGIFGLSNAGQHRPNFEVPLSQPNFISNALNPNDLAHIYNGGALHAGGFDGQGVTVAIFSPTAYSPSDVKSFLSANNISAGNIKVVNVNGGNKNITNLEEADIDIETVAGQAPGASINVYEGPNDGSLDIFNQMAEDKPGIVTESYGSDENSVTSSFAASYETLREQMAAEGITIIVASGDTGAYDSNNQTTVTVSVDASSAYVTSIGGTELKAQSNDIWYSEQAWTYNDATLGSNVGSGGGLSVYYQRPSWQEGPGVTNSSSNGMRQIPDIATLGSSPFYNLYVQGSFGPFGGTSCACQFFGGSLALIEQQVGSKLGNINPALYADGTSNASIYHDITSGNNGLYSCTANWDFVTGWGSPDFAQLALAFNGGTTASTPVHTFSSGLQMFSVPYTFASGATASELLNGLEASSGTADYLIASWNPTTGIYAVTPTAPANTLAPGQGYWARFGPLITASLTAIGTPVTTSTSSVALSPGWNIIGDPYTTAIAVDSLQVSTNGTTQSFEAAGSANIITPTLYGYDGTNYVPLSSGDSLQPYAGYWIYCNDASTLIYTAP
jgi:kumamolisin